ncbi:putative zinc-binding metallopeptidase [Anatilimnocola sp. NA78]|uniref:putative zinc-binding metallopeptidase n=1 Tax=Anatilimnocola sp. NA78 TaxID=3415683 RepID=UPI003CE455C2
MQTTPIFRESPQYRTPIRDLSLKVAGTRLEPLIRRLEAELLAKDITLLQPRVHLSTEWGVAFGSITIGIPFYLANAELTRLHDEEVGHIEGFNPADVLRYLRHETGHVVNYAYKLYEREDWVKFFGAITQPYEEDYRPVAFSKNFVSHLPGWYAQKHPDEDWAETFAVWLTPNTSWLEQYQDSPGALAKLHYCEQLMTNLKNTAPIIAIHEKDEDVGELTYSLEQYYQRIAGATDEKFPGLDGSLRAIFLDREEWEAQSPDSPDAISTKISAAALIRREERRIMAEVFRWTGHFPERTRVLIRALAQRAEVLDQVYYQASEAGMIIALTTFITSLAMNFVHRGSYFPQLKRSEAADS